MFYDVISATARGAQAKKQGKLNEDAMVVDRMRGIYITADGMGGHAGGSTASTLAVTLVHQELSEFFTLLRKNESLKDEIPHMLEQIILLADEMISIGGSARTINALRQEWNELPHYPLLAQYLPGMGTTIDACFIHDHTAYIGHVGNGRVYKMEGTMMRKITKEHVDSTIAEKSMSHDGWVLHENGLGLTNYIGLRGDPADIHIEEMRNRDTLLMVTDGFSHAMALHELISTVKEWDTAEKTMKRYAQQPQEIPKLYSAKMGATLEQARKKYNGMDNATFIAIRRSC